MTEEIRQLVAEWIDRFGEPPSIIHEELMRVLLAETDAAKLTPLN